MPTDLLKVPLLPQSHDGMCLPACAAMVLSYFGKHQTMEKLANVLGTTFFGTPTFRVQRLTRFGLQVSYQEQTFEDIRKLLAAGIPPIIPVSTGFLEYWDQYETPHAVVVVGADTERVYLNDPEFTLAPQIASVDGFIAAWVERGQMAAMIRPK